MYKRLYPNQYKSRLYLSWYERNEGGNNKILVTVQLEAKNESILGSYDHHVTIVLHKNLGLIKLKRLNT